MPSLEEWIGLLSSKPVPWGCRELHRHLLVPALLWFLVSAFMYKQDFRPNFVSALQPFAPIPDLPYLLRSPMAVKIQKTFSRIYPGSGGRGTLWVGCWRFLLPCQACVSVLCLSPCPSIIFLYCHTSNSDQALHPRFQFPICRCHLN